VPVRFAHQMGADFVIAVNISAQPEMQPATGTSTLDMLLQTFSIMAQSINQYELKDADIVIQPSLGAMKGSDFDSRNLAILAGEQAATAALPMIRQKLEEARTKKPH